MLALGLLLFGLEVIGVLLAIAIRERLRRCDPEQYVNLTVADGLHEARLDEQAHAIQELRRDLNRALGAQQRSA